MPIFKTKLLHRINQRTEHYVTKNMSDVDVSEAKNELNYLSKSEEVLLKDRGYTFNRKLGEGSYAKVYLATLRKEGKPETNLACKIINTKMAPREFIVKFLPREIDILSKITHPYIVHVYTIYHKTFNYLIFMRYAEMGDLLDYVVAKGELPEKMCKVWFHQLSCAIYYLHFLNIAHRDIKCENILITRNYNVKLADFGFARYVADANGKNILSTTYCGSLAYASPEILRGRSYFPKCSDIWSLGIVLYIMLNKCMPFHDANVKALYKQQIGKKWKFRSKVEPVLSTTAKNLVTNLLEPDFRKRIEVSELIKNSWFTEDGLRMNDECVLALEATAKLKEEMVVKKRTKIVKAWLTKDEKDFTVIAKEKEPLVSVSIYFDPENGSGKKSLRKKTVESLMSGTASAPPQRITSALEITQEEIPDETNLSELTDEENNTEYPSPETISH
ncbi:testis-specific serine/threonine-protein kinase 6-like [Rhodnius prolixus]|uniref:testis-specific serine/threonine-protein kinase 6-like n=1 Tax=Rhodnius prolixus TaxID=13249 RepID=UPI003D18EB17